MAAAFETTSWSTVLTAKEGDAAAARKALNALCRAYWPPLYAHVRRRGYCVQDAQDLTQEFFARLLECDFVARVDRNRGRFRTFLLASLDHFLASEWNREHTQRRGGASVTFSLDFLEAEGRLQLQASSELDPRRQYDRQWAQALLETVMARLGHEFAQAGKAALFEELRPCLSAPREALPYSALGERVGLTPGAVKQAVHRLRRRFALLLEEEAARTVASAAEVDEELRYLAEVIGPAAASSA